MAQAGIAGGKYDRYLKEGIVPRFGRAEDIARDRAKLTAFPSFPGDAQLMAVVLAVKYQRGKVRKDNWLGVPV